MLQLVPLVSVRKTIVWLIIMSPASKVVNGGEFEYTGASLYMLISITQQT